MYTDVLKFPFSQELCKEALLYSAATISEETYVTVLTSFLTNGGKHMLLSIRWLEKTLPVDWFIKNGFQVIKIDKIGLATSNGSFMMVYIHVPENKKQLLLRYVISHSIAILSLICHL
jgi:hypothetical protein